MTSDTEKDCLCALLQAVKQSQAELSDIRILLERTLVRYHADELPRGHHEDGFYQDHPRPTILHALLGED
jgi:hypothetical protein